MAYTIFTQCICGKADFSYANLEGSSFHSADLTNTNFSFANLKDVDFTNTTITDIQLQSALSIRNAKLPNGTVGRDNNLIKNGDANCNISLIDHWQIENGNIAVMISKEQRNKCQFSLQSIETGATMSQIIDLKSVWDSTIWKHSNIELRADMSNRLTIELSGINNNGKVYNSKIISKFKYNFHIGYILHI
jgi:uncharacterized protein YjbI with pentapeptide repeats